MQDNKIFRFPIFLRTVSIVIGLLALVWAIYFITGPISQVDKWFKKVAPFIVLVLVGNVMYKNLFTVNSLFFAEHSLKLRFLLRKTVSINYNSLRKMEFQLKPRKTIKLTFEQNGENKIIKINRGINNIIIALNMLAGKAPQVELDEFMQTIISVHP